MKSIRRSMCIWLAAGVMLLGAGAAVLCYVRAQSVLADEFDRNLMARADALTALVHHEPNGRLAITDVVSNIADYTSERRASYFQIWDSHGRTLQRSHSLKGGDIALPATENVLFWNLTLPDGRPGRAVRMRFSPGTETQEDEEKESAKNSAPSASASPAPPRPAADAPTPAAPERMTLVVMSDLAPVQRIERALMASLALATAALCVGVLIVVPVVVGHGLGAVRKLGERAAGIDAATLGQRFDAEAMPRELRPIVLRLNDLLSRLDESFGRERRFTGNVVHELRTPISELRALAEVSLRWPGDAATTSAAFREVLSIAERMESVVKMLLSLARCETGTTRILLQPCDLAAIVTNAWKAVAPTASKRKIALTLRRPASPALVASDPALLRKVIDNLLANATEYGLPNTHITCSIEPLADEIVQLTLQNQAAALTSTDATLALEPFWRKDTGGTDSQHAGLGLSLVKAYAKVLEFDLDVQVVEDSIFKVQLRMKPAKAPAKAEQPALASVN